MGYALLITEVCGDEVCRWLLPTFYRQLHIAEESRERMSNHYESTHSTMGYRVTIIKLNKVEE